MEKIDLIKQLLEHDNTNGETWLMLSEEYALLGEEKLKYEALSNALSYSEGQLKERVMMLLKGEDTSPAVEVTESVTNVETPTQVGDESENNLVKLKVIQGNKEATEGLIDSDLPEIDFSDVGGLTQLKKTINMKIIKPFLNPGLFSKFKKKSGGGILLYGPPGCGKTFIARATAGECHARFNAVHITDILDPYFGMSARNVKSVFEEARRQKPCVLFFDEVDTIGYSRMKSNSDHMRPVIDQFLSELEGVESSTYELLIIGATNTPWDVDQAFKRPGRFDKMIFVAPPDEAARAEIFKLKLEGRPISDDVDTEELASVTPLYSGADIENVIEEATEKVIERIMMTEVEEPICMRDLMSAVKGHKPTTVDWLVTIRNFVKYANHAGVYDEVSDFLKENGKHLSV